MRRISIVAGVAAVLAVGLVPNAEAGLVALYHFDETSGTTAFDSVGSVNGTLQGSATFVSGGISGGAISLSKTTHDLVNMGDHFEFADNFSVQAWVKLDDNYTLRSIPVSRHYAGISQGYFLAVNDVADGCSQTNKAHFFAEYPCSGNSTTTITDGNWHQLVGVFGGGQASIYVDGQLESSASGHAPMVPVTASFLVGGFISNGNPAAGFDGLVDEVAVWNYALTAQDVAGIYSDTVGAPEPGTIGLLLSGAAMFAACQRRYSSQ